MTNEYFRVTRVVTNKVKGRSEPFARKGERVALATKYDGLASVYVNKDGRRCWLPTKILRPESSTEAMEELLIGEW